MWGPTGLTRLFNTEFGNMMSWLLPGALVMGAVLLVVTIRARRTDRERAALLLWGGSLVSIGLVISLAQGIIHPYYTVALAPPLGALVGIGTMGLWQRRDSWVGRVGLAAGLAATVVWSYVLLGRTADWFPALRPFVAVVGALGVVAILALPLLRNVPEAGRRSRGHARLRRRAGRPSLLDGGHRGHPAQRGDPVGHADCDRRPGRSRWRLPAAAASPVVASAGPSAAVASPVAAPKAVPAAASPAAAASRPAAGAGTGTGGFPGGAPSFGAGGGFRRGAGAGGAGGGAGFLNSSQSNPALTKALQSNASTYTWAAATVNSNNAAGYQLASGEPVMAIGGFNGTDPAPTLAQFEKYVSEGKIHYFIASGGGFGGGGFGGGRAAPSDASQITSWVESHFTAETLGGVTVYNLTPAPRRDGETGHVQPSSSR